LVHGTEEAELCIKMTIKNAKKRHIAKTLTWRVIATSTTFVLSYLFFRDDAQAVSKATGVAVTEFFLKMLLYYLHERAWYKTKFGLSVRELDE
jgi:uncharacterized membrane protein